MNSVAEIIAARRLAYVCSAAVTRCGIGQFAPLIAAIESAYLTHARRDAVMPKSEYLRYPDRPSYDRIIPLLGHLGGPFAVSGLKQICSSTGNGARNVTRASGLIIMNEPQSNRPFALLEASLISAARTAAVTALAVREFTNTAMARIAMIGCGQMGHTHLRMIRDYFGAQRFELLLNDVHRPALESALALARELGLEAAGTADQRTAIEAAEIVITTTTAETPYVEHSWLRPNGLYCAVSLLDATLDVFRHAHHIFVDDLSQCLHEGRPLDILHRNGELPVGRISEIGAWLAASPRQTLSAGRIVFNPMGTVITDLAVAKTIFDRALSSGDVIFLDI
jgi:N-[(2S)-2-amino-2-carboxyethyl]-L-glutamate dehydrogenase